MLRRDDLNHLGFLLGRCYYTYIGLLERLLAEGGLDAYFTPGYGSLLFALFDDDDRTIGEVGRQLQLAKSTMTGLVKKMEKSKLLTLVTDPSDGRAARLRLTPLARSLETRVRKLAVTVERTISQRLSATQQSELKYDLSLVLTTMNDELTSRIEQKGSEQRKTVQHRKKTTGTTGRVGRKRKTLSKRS